MKLKKWVEKLLIASQFILILLLASECENTMLFVISKFIFIALIIGNGYVLNKYTNIFESEKI